MADALAGGIGASERALYERAWAVREYATDSPGRAFLPAFLEMAGPELGLCDSVIDAGCGAGAGLEALREAGYARLAGADLVDARQGPPATLPFFEGPLWSIACQPFDWVYCCDVLEHIPEEFTMLVVARLLDACAMGAFFSICLEPDGFGALVGEALHKTVRPFTWWRDRLAELGRIVECRDLLSHGLYLVEPRR